MKGAVNKSKLVKIIKDLLDSPDLNLDELDQVTIDAIDAAQKVLNQIKG
jgi:hypothetical protein